MKMYVFLGDDTKVALEPLTDKPIVSHAFDAAALRFGVIIATWTAGAFAAAVLANLG